MEGSIWSLFGLARVLFLSQGDPARVYTLLEEGLGAVSRWGTSWGLPGPSVTRVKCSFCKAMLSEHARCWRRVCRSIGRRGISGALPSHFPSWEGWRTSPVITQQHGPPMRRVWRLAENRRQPEHELFAGGIGGRGRRAGRPCACSTTLGVSRGPA